MNEYESWPCIGPEALLMQRIQQQSTIITPPNAFDPYQALLKRKQKGDDTTLPPVSEYDPNDIYELQEFCKQYGIAGFNFGRLSPKAALKMLKAQMGIKETPVHVTTNSNLLLG